MGSDHNAYLRQVMSYWEMAAAFVLHGALDAELFFDCVGENLLLLAKFHPILGEIRKEVPGFLKNTDELTRRFPAVRQRLEGIVKMVGIARRPSITASNGLKHFRFYYELVRSTRCGRSFTPARKDRVPGTPFSPQHAKIACRGPRFDGTAA